MANPQADEFTRISNELLERFCSIRVPGEAMQILLVVLRKTYGYNRKSDNISLTQFSELTNMKSFNCSRAIKKLEAMNLISVVRDKYISEYSIQKDYDKWKPIIYKTNSITHDSITEDTITHDTENSIVSEPNSITHDTENSITQDTNKRKKESLKESKERGTSFTSLKITSETLKTLFRTHTKIVEPNQKNHIDPILLILSTVPLFLKAEDIVSCVSSVFSKLHKDKGVMMTFLLDNINKAISMKSEDFLDKQKATQLKQAEIDRYEQSKSSLLKKEQSAIDHLAYVSQKIIEYSDFLEKHKSLFSQKEVYDIEKSFAKKSLALAEMIILPKMDEMYGQT